MTTTTIVQPWELWDKVCQESGLELQVNGRPGRDADIEMALRSALGTPGGAKSLQDWLKQDAKLMQPKVSTERFLVELLNSQGGFALMMNDILGTLVAAGARRSPHSMRIAFKFEGMTDPIVNTLKEFRETVARLKRYLARRYVLPDSKTLRDLQRVFYDLAPVAWTRPPDAFPFVPLLASTGDSTLDKNLRLVADLVTDVHNLWRRHGADRQEVILAAQALSGDAAGVQRLRSQLFMASDFWSHSLLAYMAQMQVQTSSGVLSAKTVNQRLSPILKSIPSKKVWVRKTVQAFIDVLNLPTWRRRHELYSVWAGTRLLEVARAATPSFRFETKDDELSFSFGGSLLATYSDQGERHEIWAELRSALVGVSKKRKGEIQPDFRVIKSGLASAGLRTEYVLECKHYLRANRSNFTTAAKDYAASCPKAHVRACHKFCV